MKKFFLILILILAALVGIAGVWYWQRNIYSKEVLKLEILSQEFVQAGEEIEYLVKLKNNGKVRLENPELIFQAPEHSVLEGFTDLRVTKKIEDIYPGEERNYSFRARLFGQENESLTARVWLSYQPKNLRARYESKTTFTSKIKFVPLTFEFDLPSKIEKGEEIEFSLNYFSNIDYILSNLRVRVDYPSGFEFQNSYPQALEKKEWVLPTLTRASGGRIEIKGKINGEELEEKIFRAQLGILKNGDFWLLKETTMAVKLVEPSLYISTLINNSQNYVASEGDLLHYEIFFKNIGKTPIQEKFLFVKLEGDFFDINTLRSEKGKVGKGDDTILWDWKDIPSLRFLDVMEEGKIEFWVSLKEGINVSSQNPKLKVEVNLAGIKKVIETKINSRPSLAQKVYREQEIFQNSGSLPPRVGEKVEYVVLWQVSNSWNDLKNAKVKAILPENVQPTGKIFPEEAKFTFDSKSREVIWNIGEVKSFQGFDGTPLTIAFQIEFTPDSSQIGKTPDLIGEAEFLAEDSWTLEILQKKASPVSTILPDDETVSNEEGIVQSKID